MGPSHTLAAELSLPPWAKPSQIIPWATTGAARDTCTPPEGRSPPLGGPSPTLPVFRRNGNARGAPGSVSTQKCQLQGRQLREELSWESPALRVSVTNPRQGWCWEAEGGILWPARKMHKATSISQHKSHTGKTSTKIKRGTFPEYVEF